MTLRGSSRALQSHDQQIPRLKQAGWRQVAALTDFAYALA